MILPFDIIILVFLIVAALIALNVKDLLSAAMIFAIYGFLICLLWAEMGAVDVAFTEETVGECISTVLFISTVLNTIRKYSD